MTTGRRLYIFIIVPVFFVGMLSCLGRRSPEPSIKTTVPETVRTVEPVHEQAPDIPSKSFTAMRLDSLGLVDIAETDPRIAVHLVYATPDNFVGEVMYHDLREAYLLPEAAAKLSLAQDYLEEEYPGYRIIVYDAARPMSVQRFMRSIAVKEGKYQYVADPAKGGGLHNYGAAVDVTILDKNGIPLPMGTIYDHLGPEANIDRELDLVAKGVITRQELENRLLLRSIMRRAGFRTVTSEWWHFNHVSRQQAQQKYSLIDF